MTDLSITAANVRRTGGRAPRKGIAGATITAGQVLFQDSADLKYKLADCDDEDLDQVDAIALTDGVDGREILVMVPGTDMNIGATSTAGTAYVLSATAGGIAPLADLLADDRPIFLFWGSGTAVVSFGSLRSPAVIPGG